MSNALNNAFKLDGIRSVIESSLSDITGAVDSLAGFNAIAADVGVGGQVYVPAGTWQLSGVPGTRVTWLLDAGATFTGAGTLTQAAAFTSAGRIVRLGTATPSLNGSMGSKIGAQSNWLEAAIPNTEKNSDISVLSAAGLIGIVGASRTSDNPNLGSMGSIGIAGYVINDNTDPTQVQYAYAGYFEARRNVSGGNNAGATQGVEIDIVNFGTLVGQAPNATNNVGITEGFRVASGGSVPGATTASAAIVVANNGALFDAGIIFQQDVFDTSGILFGKAILLGFRHAAVWYSPTGAAVASVRSAATAPTLNLQFDDNGIVFADAAGVTQFGVGQLGAINTRLAATASYANDAAASAGGVPVGTLYRNGSIVQVRIA